MLQEKSIQSQNNLKIQKWEYLYRFWRGFILLTFLLGMFAVKLPSAIASPLGELLAFCLQIRLVVSPFVALLRPDNYYAPQQKPGGSQRNLLCTFWVIDMIQWGFVLQII